MTAASARTRCKLAENATSTCASGDQTAEKLDAKEIRTMNFVVNSCPGGTSFTSERSELPRIIDVGNNRQYQSSVKEPSIEKLFFGDEGRDLIIERKNIQS